jgi:UPF0042 nucleotide-binding protein
MEGIGSMNGTCASGKIRRCVIITGMSGAGKSSALNVFEDQGFYVIDNLPPALLPQLLDVLKGHQSAVNNGVAAVIDVRGEGLLNDLEKVLSELREKVEELGILFVEAADDTLVRRFETTRRRHPLSENKTILGGLALERELLSPIRKNADIVIDTTGLKSNEFRTKLLDIMGMTSGRTSVILSSFGFKYGIPQDSDYVLDVRFLPNPNYVDELRPLSGKDYEIQTYLSGFESLDLFLEKAESLLDYVSSVYGSTGKQNIHIAIGCTGGRHRSVAVSEMLAIHLKRRGGNVIVEHRDIDKGDPE